MLCLVPGTLAVEKHKSLNKIGHGTVQLLRCDKFRKIRTVWLSNLAQ